VYRFLGDGGRILYIGKAQNLRTRLQGHLSNPGDRRHRLILEKAHTIDWTVTRGELEAMVLEAELIRLHKPPLNVDLRGTDYFPWLLVTTDEEYPRLVLTRNPDRSRNVPRFGPYPDAGNLRRLTAFLMEVHPLRRCGSSRLAPRKRPCLMGQMNRCPAPCTGRNPEEYRAAVTGVLEILGGGWDDARNSMEELMRRASAEQRYEEAARYRDLLRRLSSFGWPSRETPGDLISRDVLAVRDNWGIVVQVRGGRLMGTLRLPFGAGWRLAEPGERLSLLVRAYYGETGDIPRELLCSGKPDDLEVLEQWLGEKRGRRVRIRVPRSGPLKRLVETAERDLEHFLARLAWKRPAGGARRREAALEAVADILDLPGPPSWMVCLDASTHQGSNPVAALVSFRNGLPDREGYRRYTMPVELGRNDPAMIGEAVRRFAAGTEGPGPDLFLVDGGITQLRAAWNAGHQALAATRFASLAKREEEILTAPEEKTVRLPSDSPPVLMLRAIRDEAHRFVIHFHRTKQFRETTRSALDDVPGVGPSLKAALLREFGSVERIAAAGEEALCRVPGIGREKARRIAGTLGTPE
jgi:excinuclease ABC subunit C